MVRAAHFKDALWLVGRDERVSVAHPIISTLFTSLSPYDLWLAHHKGKVTTLSLNFPPPTLRSLITPIERLSQQTAHTV